MPFKDLKQRRAYDTGYYAANREDILARKAIYYTAHREERRVYRETHHEDIAAYYAAYQIKHPEERREYKATRRARKLDAFVEVVDRNTVYIRDEGICGICQTAVEPANWHLDHKQPLSKGGQHSYDNVQVSHPVCNERKGVR